MSNCWKLIDARVTDVVMVAEFEDESEEKLIVRLTIVTHRLEVDRVWSSAGIGGKSVVFPKLWQQQVLEDKLHAAVAYVSLTGGADGFPEFDPLID